MCEVSFDYDEQTSAWTESVVIARKLHNCDCCGGAIRPGAAYTRCSWISDGRGWSEKACAPCSVMAEEFSKAHGSYAAPSFMPELLQECIDEEGPRDPASKRWLLHQLGMDRRQKSKIAARARAERKAAREAKRAAQPQATT